MKTTSSKLKLTFLLTLVAAVICCVAISFAGIFGVKETASADSVSADSVPTDSVSADEIAGTSGDTAASDQEEQIHTSPSDNDADGSGATDNASGSITVNGRTYSYNDSYTLNGTTCSAQATIWRQAMNSAYLNSPVYLRMTQDWIADPVSGNITTSSGTSPMRTSLSGTSGTTVGFHNGSLYINEASVILDLNGHKIDRNLQDNTQSGSVIFIDGGMHQTASLTIIDTIGHGKITGGYRFGGAGGGIYALNDSVINIEGGNIVANYGEEGAGVCLSHSSYLNMYGGSISGNYAADKNPGGGVFVGPYSTFTMNGGTISNNISTSYNRVDRQEEGAGGGGVILSTQGWSAFRDNSGTGGEFIMNGGTISGNQARGHGQAVYVSANCTFEMNGGTISGHTGTAVYNNGTFSMSGGTISNNSASGNGGGVYCVGNFTMTGGSITGNTASGGYGGGVYSAKAITISGGDISLNTATLGGGGIYGADNVEISGGSISGNKYTNGSSNTNNGGGGVYSAKAITISGGSIHNNNGFRPGIAALGAITISDGSISYNHGDIGAVVSESTVTVTGGTISHNISAAQGGGVFSVGAFKITGGNIVNNTANTTGGGVYSTTSVTIEGGTIAYNNANSDGGGVYVRGTVTMSGGVVSNNTATGKGGGIRCNNNGVTMTGGSVIDNTSGNEGGGIYAWSASSVGGDSVIAGNTATGKGGGICVNATLTIKDKANISNNTTLFYGGGVACQADLTMTGGTVSGNVSKIGTAGDSGIGGGIISLSGANISGGNIISNSAERAGGGLYANTNVTVSGTANISNNTSQLQGGAIYMFGLSNTVTVNGGTISGNTALNSGGGVYSRGTFTMSDGDISRNEAGFDNGGGVYCENAVTIKGGTISDNTCGRDDYGLGGGVYSKGVFEMSSGTISWNLASYGDGGGVYGLNTVTITGGAIIGNSASGNDDNNASGGGVYSRDAFKMTGGIISNNKSTHSGGGVYGYSTVTIENGTISQNSDGWHGDGFGGGVVSHGTFIMSGGTIADNTTERRGGGVYVSGSPSENPPSATISGGVISGNVVNQGEGGGVYSGGSFTLSGSATISNNTVTVDSNNEGGGGVYGASTVTINGGSIFANKVLGSNEYLAGGGGVYSKGAFEMTDGEISSNTNFGLGGGIYSESTVTISGGTIIKSSAYSGGGIYGERTVSVSGGTIDGNTASSMGGGVYSTGAYTMTAGLIANNTVTVRGGGVYCEDTLTMEGGCINGNTTTNGNGGGIYGESTVTLSGGTIDGNSATHDVGLGLGGGVYAATSVTLSGATVSNNISGGGYGGGICSDTVNITSGMVTGNKTMHSTVGPSGQDGGGVYCTNFTMSGGTIANNYAVDDAGGVAIGSRNLVNTAAPVAGTVEITGGEFVGNTNNSVDLAALYIVGDTYSNVTVKNCRFIGNNGGLEARYLSQITLNGNTFADNSARGANLQKVTNVISSGNVYSGNGTGLYVHGLNSDVNLTDETCISNERGIHLTGSSIKTANLTGCEIKDNNYYGLYVSFTSTVVLTNCLVSSNNDIGIDVHGADLTLDHCTVSNNSNHNVCLTSIVGKTDRTKYSINILGGSFTGSQNGGIRPDYNFNLNLSGAVDIDKINFDKGPGGYTNKIKIVGALEESGKKARIGLDYIDNGADHDPYTVYTTGFATNNPGKSPSEYFYSNTTGYNVYLVNNEVNLLDKAPALTWEYSTDNGATFTKYEGETSVFTGTYTGMPWAARAFGGEYKSLEYYRYGLTATTQANVKDAGMYVVKVSDSATEWSNPEFTLVIEESATEATLTGVSASFAQTNALKTTTTLDKLGDYGTLTVKEVYSDGTEKSVTTGYTLALPEGGLKAGANEITVTYTVGEGEAAKEYKTTFNVFVESEQVEATLTGVSASFAQTTALNKTTTLDKLGDYGTLTVKEVYSDGTEKAVTTSYTLALPEGGLKKGANEITVTYTVGEGEAAKEYKTTFNVFVIDNTVETPTLTGISASFAQSLNIPNTVNINTLGDYGTLTVKEVYSDGTEKAVTTGYTLAVPEGGLNAGANEITVTYTVGEGADAKTYTDKFTIFVSEKSVTGIKATYTPNGTVYVDTPLSDIKDLVVVANYSDGSTPVTLSDSVYTLSVNGGKLIIGNNTILVTYTNSQGVFNDAFTVTVVARDPAVKSIEVSANVKDFIYSSTKLEDLASKIDLTVTATNGDGDKSVLSASEYEITAFDATTGEVTVTLKSDTNVTAKFKVVVTPKSITKITVEYTQGITVIYPDFDINELRSRLTVKVHYNDGSTAETLADDAYELAGNLAVGTNTISVTYSTESGEKYATTFTVEVTAKPDGAKTKVAINWRDTSFVFDGKEHAPVAYYFIDGGKYEVRLEVTLSGDNLTDGKAVNVGKYRAKVDVTSVKDGYELTGTDYKDFEITEAKVEINWSNTSSGEFNGNAQTPTVSVKATVNDNKVKFSVVIVAKAGSAVTADGEAVNAGEYTARLVITDGDNYTVVGDTEYDFTIAKAKVEKQPENGNVDVNKSFGNLYDAINYVKDLYGEENVTVSGIENADGGFDITVTVADESNYEWSGQAGGTEPLKFSFNRVDPAQGDEMLLGMPATIALCSVLSVAAVIAIIAFILAIKKRKVKSEDDDGFYDYAE